MSSAQGPQTPKAVSQVPLPGREVHPGTALLKAGQPGAGGGLEGRFPLESSGPTFASAPVGAQEGKEGRRKLGQLRKGLDPGGRSPSRGAEKLGNKAGREGEEATAGQPEAGESGLPEGVRQGRVCRVRETFVPGFSGCSPRTAAVPPGPGTAVQEST